MRMTSTRGPTPGLPGLLSVLLLSLTGAPLSSQELEWTSASPAPSLHGEYFELRSDRFSARLTSPDWKRDDWEAREDLFQAAEGDLDSEQDDELAAESEEPHLATEGLDDRDALPPASWRADYRAVIGWTIDSGTWNGVVLDGLSIVAVIATEGPLESPVEGRQDCVLYIDARAEPAAQRALRDLACELAPRLAKSPSLRLRRRRLRTQQTEDELRVEVERTLTVRVGTHDHGSDTCAAVCARDPQSLRPLSRGIADPTGHGEDRHPIESTFRGSDIDARWSALDQGRATRGRFGL